MEFSLASLFADGFTWQTALSLATASKLSYEGETVVTNIVRNSWGFDRCEFIDVNETQGFVASNDDVVLVAFRGTESLGDWIGNLRLRSTSRPNYGEVHSGFLGAYLVAQGEVMSALARAGASTKRVVVTGHSLGGALSAVFAGEEFSRVKVHGIYTFGQPRSGANGFQAFFSATYPNRYFRFVNDDDIVPQIPPGYVHVGKLIHFDRFGNLQQADSEAEAAQMEPPPLTEAEFFDLQRQIKEVQLGVSVADVSSDATESVVDASVEGLFPSVSDHKMDRYIAAIRRFTINTAAGDAGRAELEAMRYSDDGGLEAIVGSQIEIPVLLRLNRSDWNPPSDLKVNSRFGNICSAIASPTQLRLLENDAAVVSIEASREAGIEEVATTVPFVHGDVVHKPPLDERGNEAILGLIDSGIDVLHETFRDAAGDSRILAVWNQRDNTGPNPHALDSRFSQQYGTVYTKAQINSFIAAGTVPKTILRDQPSWHGTHVASIAAGRDVGTFGEGIAPEASIIAVIPSMRTNPGDPPSLGYSNSHVDALHFLKTASLGSNQIVSNARPMGVNVSLGMNAGAHDGSSTLEAAFDSISNSGRDPGFVIVKSAGNERAKAGHARVRAIKGGVVSVTWSSNADPRPQDYLEIWHSSYDTLQFELVDPAGTAADIVSKANPNLTRIQNGNTLQLKFVELHGDNGDSCLTIKVLPQTSPIQTGNWTLKIYGMAINSGHGIVDLWMERDNRPRMKFLSQEDQGTLSIPGTARTVITVSACKATPFLQMVDSSSIGLTRDGRPKPDLCAPGFHVVAAKAADSDTKAHRPDTGTSMAAPHVTGAVLLALSRRFKAMQLGSPKQQLNAQQIQKALTRTTQHFTAVHHEESGFGLLDVKAFLDSLD
jgi:subtilisin family serine protease